MSDDIDLDMTPAIAALVAVLDDDREAAETILNTHPLVDLVAAYAGLSLRLGKLAFGSEHHLRDALVDELLSGEVTE